MATRWLWITRWERVQGGYLLAFAGERQAFLQALTLVRALPTALRHWRSDERCWWIASDGAVPLLTRLPTLTEYVLVTAGRSMYESRRRGMDKHISAFERIRHESEQGGEYWSARDLGPLLGYSGWQRFTAVIAKAQEACANSGQAVSDHFNAVVKMVALGSGAQREIPDVHLSRYACYLIVQNGDPSKPAIAAGQTYFAVQTRRQELADEAALAGMSEDQKRLYVRNQLAEHNKLLAATAHDAGVITSRDFAIFQDHGYRGLYAGETARDIAARKGLKSGQKILDHMGSTELAANLFRATQTEEKIRREGITGKTAANQTHFEVGRVVRKTIAELGGTMPEDLPTPPDNIEQVRRREQKRVESERQPPLFGEDE